MKTSTFCKLNVVKEGLLPNVTNSKFTQLHHVRYTQNDIILSFFTSLLSTKMWIFLLKNKFIMMDTRKESVNCSFLLGGLGIHS